MGTRFGRRAADGTFEHHDSHESLIAAKCSENSDARARLFGFIGLLDGFTVKGPATQADFHAAPLRLLQTTRSALFWPGNNSLVDVRLQKTTATGPGG